MAEPSHYSPFSASHCSRRHPSSLTLFHFFNATLPHTNEYNGKIGKCKGYNCQALILPKPKISLSALEKHLHCLAGPFQVFRILLRFRCIPFSYQSSLVDKSIEKFIGKWIYFVYPKIMMPCLKWHLVHKGTLRKSCVLSSVLSNSSVLSCGFSSVL